MLSELSAKAHRLYQRAADNDDDKAFFDHLRGKTTLARWKARHEKRNWGVERSMELIQRKPVKETVELSELSREKLHAYRDEAKKAGVPTEKELKHFAMEPEEYGPKARKRMHGIANATAALQRIHQAEKLAAKIRKRGLVGAKAPSIPSDQKQYIKKPE